jgi:hypothetical protein
MRASLSFENSSDRWLRITVFLAVTSPYTTVYEEIRHENGPYSTVILVIVIGHRICAVYDRMHAVFSLQTAVEHRPGLR